MVGGESSAVERRARDRGIADCGFDSRPGNALLCPWGKNFTLLFHWGQAVNTLWWPSLTKTLQTEQQKSALS